MSIQGESTFAGLPCIFVRLTGCNLRCSYCDSAYAFRGGESLAQPDVLQSIDELARKFRGNKSGPALPLVELTGGEPLLQPASLPLMSALCDRQFTVLIETSGALDIAPVDSRVRRIMDLKCPSSGESDRNRWENVPCLRATDEVKFVIGTEEDYAWAKDVLARHQLAAICPVLFSSAAPLALEQQDPSLKRPPGGHRPLARVQLVERILADALPVRYQLQMHKFIWAPEQRGV